MTNTTRKLRQTCSVLTLCLVTAAVAGCAGELRRQITFGTWQQSPVMSRPEVRSVDVQHVVKFDAKALEVSEIEREALGMFLRQNGIQPGTQLAVASSAKSATQIARSNNRLASVQAELNRIGMMSNVVSATTANPSISGDEVVVFAQSVAVVTPSCPGYNAPIAFDEEWRPIGTLGCANAVNLGLMVVNPSDLMYGRPLGPGDAEQQKQAIARYRTGTVYPQSDGQTNVPFRITTTK
ncbi:MAG: CpaD family pilus assembly lipoprotein [Dongiaceae bacterium]